MTFWLGTLATFAVCFYLGFATGREYSDPRCFEDEVVISWHTGYTCEPLDNLPLELQRRVDE